MSCHVGDLDNNVPSKQSPNWFAFTGGGCCGLYCEYGCCDALVVLNFTTKCPNAFVNGNIAYFLLSIYSAQIKQIKFFIIINYCSVSIF